MSNYKEIFAEAIKYKSEYEYTKALEKFKEVLKTLDSEEITVTIKSKQAEVLNNLGELMYFLGKLEKAEKVYEKAYNFSKRIDDKLNFIRSSIGLGKVFDQLNEKEKAKQHFKEGADAAQEAGGSKFEARCKELLGLLLSRDGENDKARQSLEEAFALVKGDLGDPESIQIAGAITNQLGLMEFRQGNFDNSKTFFEQSLSLTASMPYCVERGEAFRYLGVIASIKKEFSDTFENHLEAVQIFKKNSFKFGLAKIYNSIGQAFTEVNLFDQSIYFLKKAAQLYLYLKSETNIAVIYSKIGDVYMKMEKYALAIQYYQKDLKISYSSDNQRGLAYTYKNLGNAYLATNAGEQVISFYEKSVELFEGFKDLRNLSDGYINLAQAYLMIDDPETAQEYGAQALELCQKSNRQGETARVHLLFGNIFTDQKNWVLANEAYGDALEVLEDTQFFEINCLVKFAMSKLLYKQGERDSAIAAITESLKYSEEHKLNSVTKKIYTYIQEMDENFLLELTMNKYAQ
ncbi:tetratricopeptide repeat protein [bacterium]|nr:tetratricopeptide repeat protein [bacterium]